MTRSLHVVPPPTTPDQPAPPTLALALTAEQAEALRKISNRRRNYVKGRLIVALNRALGLHPRNAEPARH